MPRISPRRPLVVFAAAWLLAALACQLPGTATTVPPTPGGPPSAVTPVGATAVATADDVVATASPAAVEITFGPGDFTLSDPAVGLAALSSYRATLVQAFAGTQAGQPLQWSRTYVMLLSQSPAGRLVTIETTGSASNYTLRAEVQGALFEQQGDTPCQATPLEAGTAPAQWYEPAGYLAGLIGAEAAGSETISGVETSHYTFDERALGSLDPFQTAGELWIAADAGYVVRYTQVTTGGADYFGEGIDGTLTWDYTLTDANQPVVIALPADCPPGLVDAPLLPDATDLVNQPGWLSYLTASLPADVAAFYQEQLPALGWQPLPDPAIFDDLALLYFTQANQQLSVIVTTDEAGTSVELVVGPVPPPEP